MAYLGSTPTTQSFIAGTDTFSGTGAQVAFTLTRAVNSVNDILVVVNNVDQQPSAYSVSGTTLTFTAAPSSGTNNVYVRYLSTTLQSIGVGDLSVSSEKIQAGAVTPAKVASGAYDIDISGNADTVTDGMYLSTNQTITTGKKFFSADNSGMATSTGGLNTLEVLGTGGAAMMNFHRPGAFAGYFGLDSDNIWKVGGWSHGDAAYPLLYTGSSTAPGTAPVYGCRAWVNFNGTGTVAIRNSGNVSSVTDLGNGNYRANFTTAMPNANYSSVFGGSRLSSSTAAFSPNTYAQSTTSASIGTYINSTTATDWLNVCLSIFC